MATYTYQANAVARPTLVDIIGWLWREALCLLLGLIRAALRRTITAPKHLLVSGRPDCGVDEQYATDLRVIGVQLGDDRDFGLFCGDLVPPTEPMSLADLRAEWELPPAHVPGWLTSWEDELDATTRMAPVAADDTERALTAVARREGGAS